MLPSSNLLPALRNGKLWRCCIRAFITSALINSNWLVVLVLVVLVVWSNSDCLIEQCSGGSSRFRGSHVLSIQLSAKTYSWEIILTANDSITHLLILSSMTQKTSWTLFREKFTKRHYLSSMTAIVWYLHNDCESATILRLVEKEFTLWRTFTLSSPLLQSLYLFYHLLWLCISR